MEKQNIIADLIEQRKYFPDDYEYFNEAVGCFLDMRESGIIDYVECVELISEFQMRICCGFL